MAGNGQAIIELDRKRMTAMAEKDVDTLNQVIADDLIYTHSSARMDTKQTLIGAMQSGSTVYTATTPSDEATTHPFSLRVTTPSLTSWRNAFSVL